MSHVRFGRLGLTALVLAAVILQPGCKPKSQGQHRGGSSSLVSQPPPPPPPPDEGSGQFLACNAKPRRILSEQEKCQIEKLKARCSPADDCLVSCIASPDGHLEGGGCEHACFYGPHEAEAKPPGWDACEAAQAGINVSIESSEKSRSPREAIRFLVRNSGSEDLFFFCSLQARIDGEWSEVFLDATNPASPVNVAKILPLKRGSSRMFEFAANSDIDAGQASILKGRAARVSCLYSRSNVGVSRHGLRATSSQIPQLRGQGSPRGRPGECVSATGLEKAVPAEVRRALGERRLEGYQLVDRMTCGKQVHWTAIPVGSPVDVARPPGFGYLVILETDTRLVRIEKGE